MKDSKKKHSGKAEVTYGSNGTTASAAYIFILFIFSLEATDALMLQPCHPASHLFFAELPKNVWFWFCNLNQI